MEEEMNERTESANLRPAVFFAPDHWGEIRKFRRFYSTTYLFSRAVESSLLGADGHFEKYLVLKNLCQRLIPELDKDYEELTSRGYTDLTHTEELAAVVDCLFCELYSSVNCTKTVIGAIYGKYRGISVKFTGKLFKNAGEHIIDERVPFRIREALENGQNDWFPKLKKIRDALNHNNIGSCSDLAGRRNNGIEPKVAYFHSCLGKEVGNELVTDDVFKTLSEYETKVNLFLGTVYHELNLTLEDKETEQICLIFNKRFYRRLVSPHKAIDFHSGHCMSRKWFEMEDQPTCPYTDICGAYINAKNDGSQVE